MTAAAAFVLSACTDDADRSEPRPASWSGDAFVQTTPNWRWPDRWALVTDSFGDTLTLIDRDTLAVVTQLPVGLVPLDIDGPHHAALDRQRNALYVPLAYPLLDGAIGPHNGHGLSLRDGQLLRLDATTLQRDRVLPLDPSPGDIALLTDGTVVVSHFDLAQAQEPGASLQQRRGIVSVLTPERIEAGQGALRLRSCLLPHGMAVWGTSVWVSCYGEDALARVDVANPKQPAQIVPLAPVVGPPGQPLLGPYSAVAQPDGPLLAVGCRESRDLRWFDMDSGQPVGQAVALAGAAFFAAWSPDGETVWAPSQAVDAVAHIRVADAAVLQSRQLGAACVRPHEAQLEARPEGDRLWLVCEGDTLTPGWLLVLDPQTLQTIGQVPTGRYPDRLLLGGAP